MLTQRQLFLHWFGWSFITAVITAVTLVCLLFLFGNFACRRLLGLTYFLIRLWLWFLAIRGGRAGSLLSSIDFFITSLLGCLADFTALGRWRGASTILIISVHFCFFWYVWAAFLTEVCTSAMFDSWVLVLLNDKVLSRLRTSIGLICIRKTICVNLSNEQVRLSAVFTDDDQMVGGTLRF